MSRDLYNEAVAARELLAALPGIREDEEAVEAVIGGETDLAEAAARALEIAEEAKLLREAVEARIEDLKLRAERLRAREERVRLELAQAMEMAGLKTLRLPAATLTLGAGRPKVIVTDQEALPPEFIRETVKRAPDLKALGEALKHGPVEGACLGNAQPVLTIRG